MSYLAKGFSKENASANNLNQSIFAYEVSSTVGADSYGDTFTDLITTAYFNDEISNLNVGDLIFIKGSGGSGKVIVTSVTTDVAVDVIDFHTSGGYLSSIIKHTTVGGAVSENVIVAGLTVSDIVTASLSVAGATPKTLTTAYADAGKVVLTFSGDPSTDHVVDLSIYKVN